MVRVVYESSGADRKAARALIGPTQIVLCVMVGGGFIGADFARRPLTAKRDTRAGGAPYPVTKVEAVRGALVGLAEAAGLDPADLPEVPRFHAAGVF